MQDSPARLQALIAVLLAAATAFLGIVKLAPEGSPRPVAPHGVSSEIGEEDVVARLWEDPFSAVRAAARDHQKDDPTHSADWFQNALRQRLADTSYPRVGLLAVLVPGTPFAEDAELRLRVRQALQVTMLEHRLRPHDRNHIGFVEAKWPRNLDAAAPNAFPVNDTNADYTRKPLLIPYEWFKTEWTADGTNAKPATALVVLWLPEEEFADQPLPRVRHLLSDLLPAAGTNQIEVALVGPRSSDTLRRMVKETNLVQNPPPLPANLAAVRIYSASATAPDAFLFLTNAAGRSHSAARMPEAIRSVFTNLAPAQFSFTNLTLTDDVLMALLVEELELRDIRARMLAGGQNHHRIVLISESDTFYGRAMPAAFMAAASARGLPRPEQVMQYAQGTNCPPHILAYTYLRGLDGRSARAARSASDKAQSGSADEDKVREALRQESETAAGESQMDYLERLARRLERADEAARRDSRPFDIGGIRAVGVLGSDPYDKLRIIQTLRARLPEAIFFTTDLDARLWDADNRPFTRNLLVASGFGTEPWTNRGYAGETWSSPPPFRDAYQGAAYVALSAALADWQLHTASAAGEEIGRWPGHGLFEVGRHGPVELNLSLGQRQILQCVTCPEASSVTNHCRVRQDSKLAGWIGHSRPLGRVPGFRHLGGWQLLGLALAVAGGWGLTRCWRRWINRTLPDTDGPWSDLARRLRLEWRPGGLPARCLRLVKRRLSWPEDPAEMVERAWRGPDGSEKRWQGLTGIEQRLSRVWLVTGLLLLLVIVGVASRDAGSAGGEPFLWRAGVSVWPTDILRVIVIWLVGGILVWAWMHHRQSRLRLWHKFFRPEEQEEDDFKERFTPDGIARLKKVAQEDLKRRGVPSDEVSATEQFLDFVDRARLRRRYGRIVWWTVCYLAFGFGLFFFLGTPARPFRGDVAKYMDMVALMLSVVGLVMVTFYVLDATSMIRRLLEPLADKITHWPPRVIRSKAEKLGLAAPTLAASRDAADSLQQAMGTTAAAPDPLDVKGLSEPLEGYVDVRFAAQLTRELGMRFYLPFGLLLLMVISRNRMFDQWPWTPPLIAIHLLCLGLVVLCATMLRRTARRVREEALGRLDRLREQARLGFRKQPDEKSLEMIRDRIAGEREGAFARFIQDPALIAVLIPTGGYGLFILLFQYVLRGA